MQQTIEIKRKKMMDAAKKYGITSKETVKYSQELDKLIAAFLAKNSNNNVSSIKTF
ncbi:aspartyl-phosphate phosphatase Spo0E family protein [Bacillus tianshenii]|nr:aspartyl-phosphate phosphatase Spo0E family protein [Bacillus tianshenii]